MRALDVGLPLLETQTGEVQPTTTDGRIFASLVAYCDPELPITLRSLLHHAKRPELLRVGVVWQGGSDPFSVNDLEDLKMLWGDAGLPRCSRDAGWRFSLPTGESFEVESLLDGRVRLVQMRAEDARGPCWARYLAQLLVHDEEFYLQLDSHMRFVPAWDDQMREQLALCAQQCPKPVLCCYGRSYSRAAPYDWVPPGDVTGCVNCAGFFDGTDVLNIRYRSLRRDLEEPCHTFFWSAHFSFSSSDVVREVPYDPQLQMLFYGEEILMTLRLFTNGWDLFAPSRGLVYHLWERDYRPVYMADMVERYRDLVKPSQRRLHALLGSGPELFFEEDCSTWPLAFTASRPPSSDPFGLGLARSLSDYENQVDVSFKDRRIGDFALRGGLPSEDYFIAPESGGQVAVETRCRQASVRLVPAGYGLARKVV